MTFRSWLYTLARLVGDLRAVRSGRIAPRIANKLLGRHLVSKVWFR